MYIPIKFIIVFTIAVTVKRLGDPESTPQELWANFEIPTDVGVKFSKVGRGDKWAMWLTEGQLGLDYRVGEDVNPEVFSLPSSQSVQSCRM